MTYCDTSFLMALYLESDRLQPQARQLAHRFSSSIPFTLLAELELHNGIRRNFAAGIISIQLHYALFRQITDDEADGVLRRYSLAPEEHYAKARELSKKHTPQLASRSLDILHVAAALLLKAETLASFDERQRQLAKKAGLKLLPR
jgi:predicted nucleic acid-binding protein